LHVDTYDFADALKVWSECCRRFDRGALSDLVGQLFDARSYRRNFCSADDLSKNLSAFGAEAS